MLPPCFHFENVSVPIKPWLLGWTLLPSLLEEGSMVVCDPRRDLCSFPFPWQRPHGCDTHFFFRNLEPHCAWKKPLSLVGCFPLPAANLPQQEAPDGILSLDGKFSTYVDVPNTFSPFLNLSPCERLTHRMGSDNVLSPTWQGGTGTKLFWEVAGALRAWCQHWLG